jgi:hypothetical protein
MHESNAAVIYSTKLSDQIPRSYAAHAFNQFQHSMHLFEILRLCALWDRPGRDRESIPTIIDLFNEPEFINQLVQEEYAVYANEVFPDGADLADDAQSDKAAKSWWRGDRAVIGQQQAAILREKLVFATEKAAEIEGSPRLKAMRDFRDAYIAHNLSAPEPDMNAETGVTGIHYGDETKLLEETVAAADALHHGLNRTGFDWDGSRQIAARNAHALWDNCTFRIPTRPIREVQ